METRVGSVDVIVGEIPEELFTLGFTVVVGVGVGTDDVPIVEQSIHDSRKPTISTNLSHFVLEESSRYLLLHISDAIRLVLAAVCI